jgi:hypothetical protein
VARKNAQKLQPLLGVVLPQEEGKKWLQESGITLEK